MPTQQPQFRVSGYELTRLLGRGGMGDVWLASDTRADRMVAIKFIKPGYLDDPAIRTRFLNEAKTLGRLEQDRIVTLYNVVEDGDNLALVLRFIDGSSLADRIDAQGALPLDFVAASARDILPALGFAHEHGVIHRDIKPQNVLLDKQGRSFLTDFGIAIGDFAERGTVTGFAVGTPHYMSPEQIQTPRAITVQDGGHRSDIYSYGVVLYEMLSGRVPFGGDSGVEEIYKVQHAHCVEPPPPLRDTNPSIPPSVEAVVLRCLEKKPENRPQSCAELLDEFNAALEGRVEIVTPRRSPGYAATIVERPRTSEPARSAAAPSAAPAAARAPRRGVPKAAWLAMGAVLMAGGITYAVYTAKQPQHVAEKPAARSSVVSPPPPTGNGPSKAAGNSTSVPVIPANGNKPPIHTSTPNPPAAAGPTAGQLKALEASKAANVLLLQRKYCDGKTKIDEAVNLDPQPAYIQLQDRLGNACTAFQKYGEAQSLYAEGQGGYCPAEAKMKEAIGLVPADPTLAAYHEKTKKACDLYGQ